MAVPAVSRLFDMMGLVKAMFAYELFTGLTAVAQRGETPGKGVGVIRDYVAEIIAPFAQDRSIGPDIEVILHMFEQTEFHKLLSEIDES